MKFKVDPFAPDGISPIDEVTIIQGGGTSSTPYVDPYSAFITLGDDGILYFRMESPDDGSLWDAYIDSSGVWVTTAVLPPAHGDSVLLETGDYLLLETGDTLLLE